MKKILPTLFSLITFLISCTNRQQHVAMPGDYDIFLNSEYGKQEIEKVNNEILFWQDRLQRDTGNFVDMLELASLRFRLFKLSGDIADLKCGDSLLKRSDAKLKSTDADILHALSQASITQHRFYEAASYNASALKANADLYTNCLLNFDANMELGMYGDASRQLERIGDKRSFDYLVRKAKWKDHRGNLEGAIGLMEQAFEKVKDRSSSLYCWALSNLGDMYGHAGKVEKAYRAYLDVLKKDSSFLYALKGIAWIAYSYDKNLREAKRIFRFLLSQTKMPDIYLDLAEIEEYEGNEVEKMKYIRRFIAEAERPGYGDMYNKYLVQIYTDELADHKKAIALAEREVTNRPTPETWDWLAWAYYKNGDLPKALYMARTHVYLQNFEPGALIHTALIYAANGKTKEARQMLEESLSSSFEIGPVKTKYIREQLAAM